MFSSGFSGLKSPGFYESEESDHCEKNARQARQDQRSPPAPETGHHTAQRETGHPAQRHPHRVDATRAATLRRRHDLTEEGMSSVRAPCLPYTDAHAAEQDMTRTYASRDGTACGR